jgi:hypothetical protein
MGLGVKFYLSLSPTFLLILTYSLFTHIHKYTHNKHSHNTHSLARAVVLTPAEIGAWYLFNPIRVCTIKQIKEMKIDIECMRAKMSATGERNPVNHAR